jgi:glycosyltransferase involved in cell wall biosynthesis
VSVEIVAVFPFWSQSDAMNWDSNYTYLRRILPKLSELRPDWLWYLMWPQGTKGADKWAYQDDGLFENPRIVRVPWPYDTAMRTGVVSFDPERFKAIEVRLAPTIYWLHQVESGAFFKGGYEQGYAVSVRPAIVAQHHYIIHRSLPYPFDGLFPRLWAQMGGTLAADKVVFNSLHCLKMAEESFGEFLLPSKLDEMRAKSEVLPFGLVDERLFEMPIAPHPKPVVIYNHRFESYKRHHVTAACLKDLRAAGHDFEVWVTQTKDQKVGDFPVDKVVGHPDYLTYLQRIAVPGLNTINSVHETFCISVLDSIALGQLPVVPNSLTFPELVPPDYPYLFGSDTEQTAMLSEILATWPEAYNRWSGRLREWARETFSLEAYCTRYADILDQAGNLWLGSAPRAHIQRAMDDFFRTLHPGRFSIIDYAASLRNATHCAQQAFNNRRTIREGARFGLNVEYDRTTGTTAALWPANPTRPPLLDIIGADISSLLPPDPFTDESEV